MKKTNYLIPQTEMWTLQGERPLMQFPGSPEVHPENNAPQRGGYAPGGGDLGGVPAR